MVCPLLLVLNYDILTLAPWYVPFLPTRSACISLVLVGQARLLFCVSPYCAMTSPSKILLCVHGQISIIDVDFGKSLCRGAIRVRYSSRVKREKQIHYKKYMEYNQHLAIYKTRNRYLVYIYCCFSIGRKPD